MAFLRFGVTGLVNTAIGYSVILAALWAGYGDYVANALGYTTGLVTGFLLNRNWVFGASIAAEKKSQALRYVAAFLAAYALNLTILYLFRGVGLVDSPLAQLCAMGGYTIAFFLACRHFVFAERAPTMPLSLPASWPGYAMAGIGIAAALLSTFLPLTHDVMWQLWIARQTAGGQQLYTDIVELNPPLWFWMGSAVHYAAGFLGLKTTALLSMILTGLACASAWLSCRLLPPLDNQRRFVFMLFVFLVLTIMPLYDFGQREHIALIGAVPYALLLAQRAEGKRPAIGLVIAASLLGAMAFALKHYFIVVPVLLEGLLFAIQRGKYRPLRIETLCLGIVAVAYAAAVFTFTPSFITDIVPMVALAYHGYERPMIEQFDEPAQIFWLAAIFCYVKFGRFSTRLMSPRQAVLLLSAAGFLFAYLAQQKGWQYHAIPVTGFAAIALFDAFLMRKPLSAVNLNKNRLAAGVCALSIAIGLGIGPYYNGKYDEAKVHFDGLPKGNALLFLTHAPTDAWPMTEQYDQQWISRYFAFWQLPAIIKSDPQDKDYDQLQRLGGQIVRETINDFLCHVPQRIIVRRSPSGGGADGHVYSEMFLNDPEFSKLMSNYERVLVTTNFASYDRKPNTHFRAGTGCRAIIAQ
ncbi:MAG: GtrA family protein [Pontixanthobacter sp.]